MSWAKLDDRFHGNRKVRRAWKRNRASVGLYALALTYAAQHETDGMVDAEFLDDLMPKPAERDAAVQTLVDTGLWEVAGDGYRIHDYLEYHHSAATAEAKREAKTRRQKEWRDKQSRSASTDASHDATTDASTSGHVDRAPTRPYPTDTRPDPTQPPLTPPAIAVGGLGSSRNASPPNSRAHGTSPRANARRLAAVEADERSSLALAALSKPNDQHRGEWERLHTALIGAVTGFAETYVTDLCLAAVEGDTLVVGGTEAAWAWGVQRFRNPLAAMAESHGIPARFASEDEFSGLGGTDKGEEAA